MLLSHVIWRVLSSSTYRILLQDSSLSAEPMWGLLTRARRSPEQEDSLVQKGEAWTEGIWVEEEES